MNNYDTTQHGRGSKSVEKIWRYRWGLTLAWEMACYLAAPSQLFNQYWLIISELIWTSAEDEFSRSVYIYTYIPDINLNFFNPRSQLHFPRANELNFRWQQVTGKSAVIKYSLYISRKYLALKTFCELKFTRFSIDSNSENDIPYWSSIVSETCFSYPNLVLNRGMWKLSFDEYHGNGHPYFL